MVHSNNPGIVMSAIKLYPQRFAQNGARINIADFYAKHPVASTNQWYNFIETIEVPTTWIFSIDSICEGLPFTMLTTIYDGYGKMTPKRRAPQSAF